MVTYKIIDEISGYSSIIPSLIGLLTLKKLRVNSKLIVLLCIADSIAQPAELFCTDAKIKGMCYNILIPTEYIITFFFFNANLFSKRGKKILYALGGIGFIMALYFLFFVGLKGRFISEWVCFNNIIYTAWILSLLLDIYEDDSIFLHSRMPLFWYLLGMFFFTSCTILIFGLWDYIMLSTSEEITLIFVTYQFFNISMYILYSTGILLDVSDNIKMNKII